MTKPRWTASRCARVIAVHNRLWIALDSTRRSASPWRCTMRTTRSTSWNEQSVAHCTNRKEARGLASVQEFSMLVITISNASKVRDLVSRGVYYKVTHGMGLKIVSTSQLDWPPPYKEATEKYSQEVILSRDHRSLLGYVGGLIEAAVRGCSVRLVEQFASLT